MVDIFDVPSADEDFDLEENFVDLGDDVNLFAKDHALRKILIGAGWDANMFTGDGLDLDLSLFLLDRNDTTRVDEDFVFYNCREILNGGVRHNGDSRSGAGDGDDESISIFLEAVPFDVLQIMIVISVYQGFEKEQYVSMARNMYVRVVNEESGREILRYKMDKDLEGTDGIGVVAAVLSREGPKWHFRPLTEIVQGGLPEIATRYGIIVKER